MTLIDVGNSYTIGKTKHIISKEIYYDYKKINIINENYALRILDCLSNFKKITNNRNFDKSYCALSGTLLGAIRHKGFIPTDDDMDIMIFRDLHDDINNNLETYNQHISPYKLIKNCIGFKIIDPDYGFIIDLFVYEIYQSHFVSSGPIVNNKSHFIGRDVIPFCKFHKSIILPIQKNAGQFEHLLINLPNEPYKCIEINYGKIALKKAKVMSPHFIYHNNKSFYFRFIAPYEMTLFSNFFIRYIVIIMVTLFFSYRFRSIKSGKKKCSITIGCFDLLHYGHKELFEFMRKKSDYTVCFIHDNESIRINKNITNVQSLKTRMKNVEPYVNELYPVYSADPTKYLKEFIEKNEYKYDFTYIRGNDWKKFPGIEYITEKKIKIIYKPYTKGISSSQLRNK